MPAISQSWDTGLVQGSTPPYTTRLGDCISFAVRSLYQIGFDHLQRSLLARVKIQSCLALSVQDPSAGPPRKTRSWGEQILGLEKEQLIWDSSSYKQSLAGYAQPVIYSSDRCSISPQVASKAIRVLVSPEVPS